MKERQYIRWSSPKRQWVFRIMTVLIVWILCELIIAVGRPSIREAVNTIDPLRNI